MKILSFLKRKLLKHGQKWMHKRAYNNEMQRRATVLQSNTNKSQPIFLKRILNMALFNYTLIWANWIHEVEHEAEMQRRATVLKRRF